MEWADGEVVSKVDFGYFIKLNIGLVGLLHVNKVKGQIAFKPKQKIKVKVQEINIKKQQISLGL